MSIVFFSPPECVSDIRVYVYACFCVFIFFFNVSVPTSTFRPNAKVSRSARPDTMVEVWARSVHSGTRGERSTFFFGGTGMLTTFLVSKALLFFKRASFFVYFCHEHTPNGRQQQQQCRACLTSLQKAYKNPATHQVEQATTCCAVVFSSA